VASGQLVVTFKPASAGRDIIAATLGGIADIVYLPDLDEAARAPALAGAAALLAYNTGKELRPHEPPLLADARLIQFMTAGVDHVPLRDLPPGVPVAGNAGAYAAPMAEHAVAMALAAAKRLLVEQPKLARGEFNQFQPNKQLAGGVFGVFGFGGVGIATARLLRAFGMQVHAINRRGASEEPVEWIGTADRLDDLLAAADVLLVSTPLTRATRGVIDARALGLMKPDAILINLARGEIVDEAALYAHLLAHPDFTACIDAWWVEPVRHGAFRMDHPFMSLPNVIGSPHNSGSSARSLPVALERAVANCRRALLGEVPRNLIGPDDIND
jgi:phosphoglycerate dehydrogenase-like enzyme